MRILNIVSSNIVQDPRILKQMETIKQVTDDYIVLGKMNAEVTDERLAKLDFHYKLIGSKVNDTTLLKKIVHRIQFGRQVIRYIRNYRPAVIHANDFDVLLITYLSRYKGARIIYDAHEIYSKNAFINKIKILSHFVQRLEKHIIKHIDHFITVSHAAKGYYQAEHYPKIPVVITNAPIKQLNEKQTWKKDTFEVVYQGQIVSDRGYEEFMEAGTMLADEEIELVIRGFGPLKQKLQDKQSEMGIRNVRFAPPVEMDELVSKLRESSVGVILTKGISINFEYTVSNKIFECIHAGLPVILSPVKEHIYLNDTYQFGIVLEEVTPQKIATAITTLKNDTRLYAELEKNATAAAQQLTWQVEEQKLIALYTKS
ncbi:glycosyltransferase [Listeria grayi]|nr:glycosyltransferase [Listeria grayi]